jgi:hypothetical protein
MSCTAPREHHGPRPIPSHSRTRSVPKACRASESERPRRPTTMACVSMGSMSSPTKIKLAKRLARSAHARLILRNGRALRVAYKLGGRKTGGLLDRRSRYRRGGCPCGCERWLLSRSLWTWRTSPASATDTPPHLTTPSPTFSRHALKGPLYAVKRYSLACRRLRREISNPVISLAGTGRLNK